MVVCSCAPVVVSFVGWAIVGTPGRVGDFAVHLQEMLDDGSFQATEQGVWINHEDVNPATGEVEDKHFWLVEHDGLVFGSGWNHDGSEG